MRGEGREGAGHGPVVDGRDLPQRRPGPRLHDVHRQRQEDRPRGRGGAVVEGAAQEHRKLVGARDLAGPFHGRAGDRHEIAEQERIGDDVPGILLARRHHEGRARDLGIEQIAYPVPEAARRVQVEKARPARRLGVAIGHGDGARLLERQHVGDVGRLRQGVDQRKLGRPGIAEDVADALAAQNLDEHVGASALRQGFETVDRHGRTRRRPARRTRRAG